MLCSFPGLADVNVYGVVVPGAEGRVGMAAIKFDSATDVDDFDWHVSTPRFAKRLTPVIG